MPRDLPLSNGKLLVCFDLEYRIRDVFYPHVGQENHAGGHMFRLGVWVDGAFSWSTTMLSHIRTSTGSSGRHSASIWRQ